MKKEICFFSNRPLTKRDHDRLGFELLAGRGFKVTYLDMSEVFNKKYAADCSRADRLDHPRVVKARDLKEIEDFLIANRGVFGIDIMKPNFANLAFFKLLKKYGVIYASLCISAIPVGDVPGKGAVVRAGGLFSPARVVKKLKHIFMKFSKYGIRPADHLIRGGYCDPTDFLNTGRASETIWAHALDYDLYLKFKAEKRPPLIEDDYAVFLDEYFPLHPDHLVEGARPNPYKEASEYYDELGRMLDLIERALGMQVVIAAHPRSQYEKMKDPFGGRTVIKGRTIELAAYSQAAVTHGSTSANQAVLFRKPVIFLMPGRAKGTYYERFISNFAKKLGKAPFDMDNIGKADLKKELTVNSSLYDEYIYNYIKTPGSPGKYFWDIIADTAEKA